MSDYDFGDDDFDESFFQHVDALEAAASQAPKSTVNAGGSTSTKPAQSFKPATNNAKGVPKSLPVPPSFSATGRQQTVNPPQRNASVTASSRAVPPNQAPSRPRLSTTPSDSDGFDTSIPLSPTTLAQLEQIEAAYRAPTNLRQTTIDGRPLPEPAPPRQPTAARERNPSANGGGNAGPSRFGRPNQRSKQWDQTAFAATGSKNKGKAAKGKRRREQDEDEEEEEEEEEFEFEQFPAPFVSRDPPPPMKLVADREATKEWIYPLNRPLRDYQFNIVQAAMFKNTLVALPTGLGKTFIAGVVMLNYYRWFPQGRIVFVAPTKPLVAQQIEACHEVCGIPGSDATEMTGKTPQAQREKLWKEKRVVYMTPQTLQNDLMREIVDARDIILLVVDEAHRATGQYAYATVVRYLMAKNPHFRVLALTATPGGKPETVQEIVDSLHIGHIEIRDERSLDLKEYIHEKALEKCIVPMDEGIMKIKQKIVELMEKSAQSLRGKNILPEYRKMEDIRPYFFTSLGQGLHSKPEGKKFPWASSILYRLATLARAMSYLLEQSVEQCYTTLQDMGLKKTSAKENKLLSDTKYREVMSEIENYRNDRLAMGHPVGHPKMDKLSGVALQHFADAGEEEAQKTKVMVFCQYRDCVDEIVKTLNTNSPMIRAVRFIGQSTDKRGTKGVSQKDQIETINQFKKGTYNVLVATSIGEEGLDIGEVDLIICYDVQKSSIKMLQRVGRTGRKRSGNIITLMAEGREEENWDAAVDSYASVQQTILRGDQLELFDDDEHLIPNDARPVCRKKEMPIERYVRESPRKRKPSGDAGEQPAKRRKRNDDPTRNIPEGAMDGFVSAAQLVVKDKKGKRKVSVTKVFDPEDLEDDEDDLAIERGLLSSPSQRKREALRVLQSKHKTSPQRRRSEFRTAEDIQRALQDDSDDMDIEEGIERILRGSPGVSPRKTASASPRKAPRPSSRKKDVGEVLEISSDDEDDDNDVVVLHVSPVKASPAPHSLSRKSAPGDQPVDASWLLESDSDFNVTPAKGLTTRSLPQTASSSGSKRLNASLMDEMDADVEFSPVLSRQHPDLSSPIQARLDRLHPQKLLGQADNILMGPPPVPVRTSSPGSSPFVVRRPPGIRSKKKIVLSQEDSSGVLPSPSLSEKSSPPPPQPLPKRSRPKLHANPNPFFDLEAELSGSDHAVDASDRDDWSESDRMFCTDSPATQAVPKGEEQAMYLQGLMTQAPGGLFRNGPARRGPFGGGWPKPRIAASSSEGDLNSEPNEYEFGSFIVPDDTDPE